MIMFRDRVRDRVRVRVRLFSPLRHLHCAEYRKPLEPVIYTPGAQANSSLHPCVVGKWVAISTRWYTKIVSRCRRTLRGESHSETGWSIGGSVEMQIAGRKSVRSGNGRPLIARRYLLLILVSTPLRSVNRGYSGFPVTLTDKETEYHSHINRQI